MNEQIIRDAQGHLLGKIIPASGGRLAIQDKGATILGYYDPQTDRTTRANGMFVGTGNLLTTLLR